MRVVKMYCDRCDKEFEKWNYRNKHDEVIGIAEIIYEDGDRYLDDPKDLCESCYTELEKWWASGRKEESEETQDEGNY